MNPVPTRHPVPAAVVIVMLACLTTAVRAQEVVVSPDGPVRTLREAVARAPRGGRIVVRAGTYREAGQVTLDRPVELVGEGRPVFDGQGQHQILLITGDSVTVRGLVFRNVATSFVEDRAAVKVDGGHACRIEDNRFEDTFFGVYLARSAHCRVSGNTLQANNASESRSGNGIHLWYARDVVVEGNRVSGHRDGIYLEFVEDSEVRGNVSERNLRYGLHFMFSDRCRYRDNVLRHNDAGVAVMYSKNVHMLDNRFEHNWGSAAYGLLLKDISDSEIRGNVFVRNTVGIYMEGSNRTRVEDNDLRENGWAVRIMANAEDNTFRGNAFIANTFDVATNSRHSCSRFAENYWDSYRGYDLDRDGYGDVAFRPVRLFSLLVERNEPSLILLRSFFVDLLDAAERVLPALTPETLIDEKPLMRISRHRTKAVGLKNQANSQRPTADSL